MTAYPTAEQMRERPKGSHGVAADRFGAAYIQDPSGCWRWVKGLTGTGYGHFSIASIYYQAHRIAYILHRGPVPTGMQLDHLCRNRWCVNPWHLDVVTHQENVRRGASTRLDVGRAAAIREAVAAGHSYRTVGRWFGVDHSTVSRIVGGLRWAPVAEDVAA